MLDALAKSIDQLFAPELRRVLWKMLGATLLVFAGLWIGCFALLDSVSFTDIAWLDRLAGWLGGLLGVVLTLVLFAPVATMVAAIFQDEVADAVEARYYPDLVRAPGQPVGRQLAAGARLLAWTVAVNLLCLPLYLLPVANIVIFFAANGYLLSREYFEAVALRRADLRTASAFRRRHRFGLWRAGIVVALAFWVPVVNLAAPILGTALFVHVVERRRRRDGGMLQAGVLSA